MSRHTLLFLVVFLGCFWKSVQGFPIQAVPESPEKRITAQRIENPIVIDGELDESQWDLVEPVHDFVQQQPNEGEAATELTEVRLLYDDQYLYIGAYCFDSEGEQGMVITDMRRDYPPFDNDTFVIVLDTFGNDRDGYLFSTNPVGSKHDSQIGNDGGKSNRDWDGIWHVKTKITEAGWQAEIAIPFKTLRFRNDENQVWGVNFQRRIRRKNEAAHWSLVPRPYFIPRVSRAGRLEGLSGIRPGRNLYVKPYISVPVTRREGDDVDFLPEVGLDFKAGLGSQLTLDLTVNTDFAQVEADDEQINLTRFSLFFPEKREFFLENASLFQFGPPGGAGRGAFRDLVPFFSRRIGLVQGNIVPILGGARLTGKISDYTLGVLSLQVDDFETIPSTNFSVFRLRRDVFRKSEIGGIFINKQERDGDFNRTFGADANFTFFDFLEISSFLLGTTTPQLQNEDLAGFFRIGWRDPRLTAEAGYLSIQENFNPEVGFVPRTEIRKTTGVFEWRQRPGERIPTIREFRPRVAAEYVTDQENVLETRTVEGRFTIDFQSGAAIWFAGQSQFERLTEPFFIRSDQAIPEGDYPYNEYTLSLSSDRSRLFSGDLRWVTGGFFDGDKDSYRVTGRFQRPQFQTEISWSHDDVHLPSGDFNADLLAARLSYSFNPSMFLNALIQYNSDEGEISSNIRFNLIHKPLSDFFLVYNERRTSTGEVRERALIGKLTYLFAF